MDVIKTNLDGVLVIQPDVFKDERGFFFESFNKTRYENLGINGNFVQDNISKSSYGTIRGLHYQVGENAQGKLCFVISGKVLDIAVDVRFNSPTFGQYASVELSEENKNQIWIPPGFAHGFSVLSETAVFCYKCTGFYSKPDERSIIYNDPELSIDWKIIDPIVSDKDMQAKYFKDIKPEFFSNN